MEFNKTTGKRKGNKPSITFRTLPDTGNGRRYQGAINKNGFELMLKTFPKLCGLEVVFSDKHSIIGFKALPGKNLRPWFGATELFESLKLVTYKRYKLTECPDTPGLLIIDSNEFKDGTV